MIKVGIIDFVNANPLFHALRAKKVPCNSELILGNPLQINERLRKGEIDIALISSAEFLQNRPMYVQLSNLGVASTGNILSVRLFYKSAHLSLHKKTVLVPPASTTSLQLLQSLSKNFWNFDPYFQTYSCPIENLFEQDDPFLLIGNDCLQHLDHKEINSLDLGEAWHAATNKSLIYSLVATHVRSFKKHPDKIVAFHKELETSFKWSQSYKEEIIEASLKACPCSKATLVQYFKLIEYQLTSKHFQGLNYYSSLHYEA